jgi:hypothetical protein
VIDEIAGALLDEDHFSDVIAAGIGEVLIPDDGEGVGAA